MTSSQFYIENMISDLRSEYQKISLSGEIQLIVLSIG